MTATLGGLTVTLGKKLKQSDDFLKAKHNLLSQFDSIDDLVTDEKKLSAKDRQAIEHHILQLRAAIARTLWSNEFYIGRSLLDDYILHIAKNGSGDVPACVIAGLAAAGADRPGFVLYPLTGFGMEMPGIFAKDSKLRSEAVFKKAGFAVSTQSNSFDAAVASIERMARGLGVKQRIDKSDFRHFAYTAKWFGKNPLMLVRVTSFTGDMYENQFIYSLKIRVAAANLLMLHCLSQEAVGPLDRHHNSSFVNNFETLDIAHYLIGEAIRGRPMSTRRVPMNVSQLELAKLSDVAATLSTSALATSRMRRLAPKVTQALNTVERGYFRHVNLATHSKPENRLYRRLLTALDWFRQSFSARANEAEAIVALAVAFETLLTDQYAPAIAERLRRRIGICMKGVPGLASYQASVLAIYYARSSIVHTGEPDHAIDIHRGQVAFTRCFCAIAERLTTWTPAANNVMGDLLGDVA
ncbi:HEPN domain-containing protein [Sphingomonas sp. NPDC092331]|jgi:TPR repeat protein|uniref:HEPN domain-containing protein n=1 Tax=unclassified Sphingomonas TaxID=196159 RepID=UPI0024548455|nr:HEPN domain-containing protein [Sphingomonas sp. CBMAI 2297]MDH4744928.1 HEPN domain-containing protein [Sphingomonas sp. CBMAI 2297]